MLLVWHSSGSYRRDDSNEDHTTTMGIVKNETIGSCSPAWSQVWSAEACLTARNDSYHASRPWSPSSRQTSGSSAIFMIIRNIFKHQLQKHYLNAFVFLCHCVPVGLSRRSTVEFACPLRRVHRRNIITHVWGQMQASAITLNVSGSEAKSRTESVTDLIKNRNYIARTTRAKYKQTLYEKFVGDFSNGFTIIILLCRRFGL